MAHQVENGINHLHIPLEPSVIKDYDLVSIQHEGSDTTFEIGERDGSDNADSGDAGGGVLGEEKTPDGEGTQRKGETGRDDSTGPDGNGGLPGGFTGGRGTTIPAAIETSEKMFLMIPTEEENPNWNPMELL